jgi:uncharacterized protein YegP (UPF0339 family)
MATATKQAGTTPRRAKSAAAGTGSQFVVFQSNAGDYRWELVAENGAVLAQSASFASFDDAERAADRVRGVTESTPSGSRRLSERPPAARSTPATVRAGKR